MQPFILRYPKAQLFSIPLLPTWHRRPRGGERTAQVTQEPRGGVRTRIQNSELSLSPGSQEGKPTPSNNPRSPLSPGGQLGPRAVSSLPTPSPGPEAPPARDFLCVGKKQDEQTTLPRLTSFQVRAAISVRLRQPRPRGPVR